MVNSITLRVYLDDLRELLTTGAATKVITHCHHILQHFPQNVEAYRLLARALHDRGKRDDTSEYYDEAMDVFLRVLSVLPNDVVSHREVGQIYYAKGQIEQAIWHVERAYEQQPGDNETQELLREFYAALSSDKVPAKIQLTRGALARQYINGKLFDQALIELRTALEETPNRIGLQVLLAETLWETQHPVEAGELALQILKKLPYCLSANRIMARLWLDNERPTDAQMFLARIEALDPYAARNVLQPDTDVADPNLIEPLDYDVRSQSELSSETPDWLTELDSIIEGHGDRGPFGVDTLSDDAVNPFVGAASDWTTGEGDVSDAGDAGEAVAEETFADWLKVVGETPAGTSELPHDEHSVDDLGTPDSSFPVSVFDPSDLESGLEMPSDWMPDEVRSLESDLGDTGDIPDWLSNANDPAQLTGNEMSLLPDWQPDLGDVPGQGLQDDVDDASAAFADWLADGTPKPDTGSGGDDAADWLPDMTVQPERSDADAVDISALFSEAESAATDAAGGTLDDDDELLAAWPFDVDDASSENEDQSTDDLSWLAEAPDLTDKTPTDAQTQGEYATLDLGESDSDNGVPDQPLSVEDDQLETGLDEDVLSSGFTELLAGESERRLESRDESEQDKEPVPPEWIKGLAESDVWAQTAESTADEETPSLVLGSLGDEAETRSDEAGESSISAGDDLAAMRVEAGFDEYDDLTEEDTTQEDDSAGATEWDAGGLFESTGGSSLDALALVDESPSLEDAADEPVGKDNVDDDDWFEALEVLDETGLEDVPMAEKLPDDPGEQSPDEQLPEPDLDSLLGAPDDGVPEEWAAIGAELDAQSDAADESEAVEAGTVPEWLAGAQPDEVTAEEQEQEPADLDALFDEQLADVGDEVATGVWDTLEELGDLDTGDAGVSEAVEAGTVPEWLAEAQQDELTAEEQEQEPAEALFDEQPADIEADTVAGETAAVSDLEAADSEGDLGWLSAADADEDWLGALSATDAADVLDIVGAASAEGVTSTGDVPEDTADEPVPGDIPEFSEADLRAAVTAEADQEFEYDDEPEPEDFEFETELQSYDLTLEESDEDADVSEAEAAMGDRGQSWLTDYLGETGQQDTETESEPEPVEGALSEPYDPFEGGSPENVPHYESAKHTGILQPDETPAWMLAFTGEEVPPEEDEAFEDEWESEAESTLDVADTYLAEDSEPVDRWDDENASVADSDEVPVADADDTTSMEEDAEPVDEIDDEEIGEDGMPAWLSAITGSAAGTLDASLFADDETGQMEALEGEGESLAEDVPDFDSAEETGAEMVADLDDLLLGDTDEDGVAALEEEVEMEEPERVVDPSSLDVEDGELLGATLADAEHYELFGEEESAETVTYAPGDVDRTETDDLLGAMLADAEDKATVDAEHIEVQEDEPVDTGDLFGAMLADADVSSEEADDVLDALLAEADDEDEDLFDVETAAEAVSFDDEAEEATEADDVLDALLAEADDEDEDLFGAESPAEAVSFDDEAEEATEADDVLDALLAKADADDEDEDLFDIESAAEAVSFDDEDEDATEADDVLDALLAEADDEDEDLFDIESAAQAVRFDDEDEDATEADDVLDALLAEADDEDEDLFDVETAAEAVSFDDEAEEATEAGDVLGALLAEADADDEDEDLFDIESAAEAVSFDDEDADEGIAFLADTEDVGSLEFSFESEESLGLAFEPDEADTLSSDALRVADDDEITFVDRDVEEQATAFEDRFAEPADIADTKVAPVETETGYDDISVPVADDEFSFDDVVPVWLRQPKENDLTEDTFDSEQDDDASNEPEWLRDVLDDTDDDDDF